MVYVGLYQSRAVRHLWCPVFSHGCETVADATFAKPFGIPDGYLGAAMYAIILLLLLIPTAGTWVRPALLTVAILATLANVLGIREYGPPGQLLFLVPAHYHPLAAPALAYLASALSPTHVGKMTTHSLQCRNRNIPAERGRN